MREKWLPYPMTSVGLLMVWLLINQSVYLGHWLLGGALAIAIPLLLNRLQPMPPAKIHRPWVLFRLLSMALVEIIRSCFNVSRLILSLENDRLRSQFLLIPLDLRDRNGLALLSCLINTTPGTVWVEMLADRSELALHVFDLHDEQWWIDTIKKRYEGPLIEIFEGRTPP